MLFAKNKTRRPPGCGKSRSVESEENQKQVFLPSHRPWKSRTTRAIPTFPTAPTAAGFSTSLITKVGVGPNETIERGQIKLTNANASATLDFPLGIQGQRRLVRKILFLFAFSFPPSQVCQGH